MSNVAESVKYTFTAKMQCESKVFETACLKQATWSVNADCCLGFQHSKQKSCFWEV